MIIDSYDDKSEAIINPKIKENPIKVDACIVTFSNIIQLSPILAVGWTTELE